MTCRFFAALAVLLGLLLASVASMAQEKSQKSTIDDVVKQCVDVVHHFPADKSDLSFFENKSVWLKKSEEFNKIYLNIKI